MNTPILIKMSSKYKCPKCNCGLLTALITCFVDNEDGTLILPRTYVAECDTMTCRDCGYTDKAMEFGSEGLRNNTTM